MRRDELAALREFRGFTQESLAHAMGATAASVSAGERGLRRPNAGHRRALAALLKVSLTEIERLLDPDAQLPKVVRHEVPRGLTTYHGLVQGAGRLDVVERTAIHDLLQTPDYADAIERLGPNRFSEADITARVEGRLARQDVLFGENPLDFTIFIAESALTEEIGGRAVMAAQLDHLGAMAARPNITIRVVPGQGLSVCGRGGFELLTKPGDTRPFLVVTFDVRAHYEEHPDLIASFLRVYDHLEGVALPADESLQRIHELRETFA